MNHAIEKQVSAAVRSLDPYPRGLDGRADRDRAGSTLEQILASDPSEPTGAIPGARRRRAVWLAAPLVAAGIAAVLIMTQGSPAGSPGTTVLAEPPKPLVYVAASDSTGAPESLSDFADRVAALPPDPAPDGPILRITMRGFYLATVVGEDGVASTLEEHHDIRYIADDVATGPGSASSPTWWGGVTLSDDVDELRRQLQIAHPVENGAQSVLAAITDLYREAAPGPGVRAGILRILAEQPGIEADGTVVDRAGRTGVGYSIVHSGGGLPVRVTLIFDPDTGWLLDHEELLISDAGKLNVPIPSVLSYEIYASYDYVDSVPTD